MEDAFATANCVDGIFSRGIKGLIEIGVLTLTLTPEDTGVEGVAKGGRRVMMGLDRLHGGLTGCWWCFPWMAMRLEEGESGTAMKLEVNSARTGPGKSRWSSRDPALLDTTV